MLILETQYQKRLGLPSYSSHSFQVSLKSEITDLDNIQDEVARLYGLLQQSVDREIQQTGFVPDDSYGEDNRRTAVPVNAPTNHSNGNGHHHPPAGTPAAEWQDSGNSNGAGQSVAPTWQCSAKQHKLIGDLARRLGLTDQQLDERAWRLFTKPAHQLNKLSASGLISDLLTEAGPQRGRNNGQHAVPANGNGGQA